MMIAAKHHHVVPHVLSRFYSLKTNKLSRILDSMSIEGKQKSKVKARGRVYVPGVVNFQVIGNGGWGTPASVYLFTDQSRFLFNVGEGTQRLAQEHKAKLSRLEHIFVTRTSWSRIGGLPGLCLTVQDAGVQNLALHGPSGLDELFKAMKRFVVLKDLKVTFPEIKPNDVYNDEIMTLQYIPIFKETSPTEQEVEDDGIIVEDNTDYYAHENKKSPKFQKRKLEQNTISSHFARKREECVFAYIGKLKPRPGTLSYEKCVDHDVPPGPLFGQLKNGIDIRLPNGTLVKANDVREPCDPGSSFAIVDIPSEAYLKSFQENEDKFRNYQENATDESDIALTVLHFTPRHILNNKIYLKFMESFSPSTQHIVLNYDNNFSGYVSAHKIQHQLNHLHPNIFPLLNEQNLNINPLQFEIPVQRATSSTLFHLRPKNGLDRRNEAKLCPEEFLNEMYTTMEESVDEFKIKLDEFRNNLQYLKGNVSISRDLEYPKVIFLGTGSCIPNKTRNVSSILIRTNETSSILLDCGENTVGQIIRFYGAEEAEKVIRSIKIIYISHLHADHHLGLIGVLKVRRKLLTESDENKVILLAPEQISSWLSFYDKRIEEISKDYNLVKNADLLQLPYADNELLNSMDIDQIVTCYVKHCPHSFGVAITMADSGSSKITYSGDTMPCFDLVRIGENSTLLIHEATMEDELVAEARIKMHSTVSQAIAQGKKMNAKCTILTHFSQRYAKIPRINCLEENLGVAFDNMEVTLSDLPHLHLLYPLLKYMFMEHFEELEAKALKRACKKQRMNDRN